MLLPLSPSGIRISVVVVLLLSLGRSTTCETATLARKHANDDNDDSSTTPLFLRQKQQSWDAMSDPSSTTDFTVAHRDAFFTNALEKQQQVVALHGTVLEEGDAALYDHVVGVAKNIRTNGKNSSASSASTNATSGTCAGITSCAECAKTWTCHWCGGDQRCHARGSVHGCLYAPYCKSSDDDNNHHDDSDDDSKNKSSSSGCASHSTCSECALSSHLCHWCAHDNACHAVGSVYGCASGVDCYSNDRCKRKEPEPITGTVFTEMGTLPMAVILSAGAILFCCLSTCFCVASGVKGAYDDLAHLAAVEPPHDDDDEEEEEDELLFVPASQNPRPDEIRLDRGGEEEEGATAGGEGTASSAPQVASEASNEHSPLISEEEPQQQQPPQQQQQQQQATQDYVPLPATANGHAANPFPVTPSASSTVLRRQRRHPYHMQRLYNACLCCYVFALAAVAGLVFCAVRYYPKRPDFNICNDSVAWKSLVDSLTAAKISAEFEILASVSNPNHFAVALDKGTGSFRHDGDFVGTFEIPPVVAPPMAVTDVMAVAQFTPERWQALGLAAAYYRGVLVLHVDAQATVRIPDLFDYALAVKINDLVVHVNEMSDRHLCACPNWDEERNRTRRDRNRGGDEWDGIEFPEKLPAE